LVRQSASHFTRQNKKKIGDNSSLQKLSGSPKRFVLFHSKSKQISRLTNSVELSMFPIDGFFDRSAKRGWSRVKFAKPPAAQPEGCHRCSKRENVNIRPPCDFPREFWKNRGAEKCYGF
jgi:hypothetical protein